MIMNIYIEISTLSSLCSQGFPLSFTDEDIHSELLDHLLKSFIQ